MPLRRSAEVFRPPRHRAQVRHVFHQRLAVGEAPACVQACPDKAIKITLVENLGGCDVSRIVLQQFPADAPDPAITLPTTRFLSGRPTLSLPTTPRHDWITPHWPLVIILTLTQTAGIQPRVHCFGARRARLPVLPIVRFHRAQHRTCHPLLRRAVNQPKPGARFSGWRKAGSTAKSSRSTSLPALR